ncbi:MAG: hypothetical protein ABI158_11235 [Edaphobacter sp.]
MIRKLITTSLFVVPGSAIAASRSLPPVRAQRAFGMRSMIPPGKRQSLETFGLAGKENLSSGFDLTSRPCCCGPIKENT